MMFWKKIKAEDDAPKGTKAVKRIGGQLYASKRVHRRSAKSVAQKLGF